MTGHGAEEEIGGQIIFGVGLRRVIIHCLISHRSIMEICLVVSLKMVFDIDYRAV